MFWIEVGAEDDSGLTRLILKNRIDGFVSHQFADFGAVFVSQHRPILRDEIGRNVRDFGRELTGVFGRLLTTDLFKNRKETHRRPRLQTQGLVGFVLRLGKAEIRGSNPPNPPLRIKKAS